MAWLDEAVDLRDEWRHVANDLEAVSKWGNGARAQLALTNGGDYTFETRFTREELHSMLVIKRNIIVDRLRALGVHISVAVEAVSDGQD